MAADSQSEIVAVPKGLRIFKMEFDCESKNKPTAELWINYGQPFYSRNIKKMYNLPVLSLGNDRWTTFADVTIPVSGKLPMLMKEKRWVVFKNSDGITKGPEFQIRVE